MNGPGPATETPQQADRARTIYEKSVPGRRAAQLPTDEGPWAALCASLGVDDPDWRTLGLGMAASVVRLHGGSLTLSRSPLGGLRTVVRIPAS